MKVVDICEYAFLSVGLAVSLTDIKEVLCIILLVIDAIWLLLKFVLKFISYAKDGELSEEELEDLKSDIKNKEGDKHVND